MPNSRRARGSAPAAHLTAWGPQRPVAGLVLVLHGGQRESVQPTTPRQLAVLRMWPVARALHRAGAAGGIAVWALRNRHRGWNHRTPAGEPDPVADVRWALQQARTRLGEPPVVLVGHSMGGRAALRAAGDPLVRGVAALAPWLPDGEPVGQLAGRDLLIAHGDRERRTDPAGSYAYALRARTVTPQVSYFAVHGDGHAMLRRAADWHALARDFALGVLGLHPLPAIVANAYGLRGDAPDGLAVPLPRRWAEGRR